VDTARVRVARLRFVDLLAINADEGGALGHGCW
jgi:hypothetical protein